MMKTNNAYFENLRQIAEKWEQETNHTTSITQERLDRVSLTLLFLVHHVAHHHLEWLHGHVDTGIEQHQHQ